MTKMNILISIAAGEALLFLEKAQGGASIGDFEQFLRDTGPNIYLVLGLLISERLIAIIRDADGHPIVKPQSSGQEGKWA